MDVTSLDGRGYAKFLAAGTYFLRKYRAVLNDLNVFPVPDGDTGTNMYLTVRSAMLEAGKLHTTNLAEVAAAAAQGSLMGARGNSGVIISQMLRGFAHHVRHRSEIDTFVLATAMREAVAAARQALLRPVEGTILSVAEAAAEAAYKLALHERDFYRLGVGIVRAANEALDRTPDQLPVLKEAQVVDSGGAGFVYFVEGILRFLPESRTRTTAFPRRPVRQSVFTPAQTVGENKFCTEFLLQDATVTAHDLRHLLEPRGESLLVIGAPPTIKVHIHTDNPDRVQDIAGRHGRLTRVKVDNMERQHQLLVVEPPSVSRSIVAIVPGPGFERIARELGAEVTMNGERNPSVRDLLLAVNKTLGSDVYLFVNDKNVALAAKELSAMTDKRMHVMATRGHCGRYRGALCDALGRRGRSQRRRDYERGTRCAQRAAVPCRKGFDGGRRERGARKAGSQPGWTPRGCADPGRDRDRGAARDGGGRRRPGDALLRRRTAGEGCATSERRAQCRLREY